VALNGPQRRFQTGWRVPGVCQACARACAKVQGRITKVYGRITEKV